MFALGVANGAFAVAAIGSMMGLAGTGREAREGVRMGLWGAAQAIAFGLGGFSGTVAADLARHLHGFARTSPTAPCSRPGGAVRDLGRRSLAGVGIATPSRATADSPTAGARYAAGLGGR